MSDFDSIDLVTKQKQQKADLQLQFEASNEDLPPFDPLSLSLGERALLFGNLFNGTVIPDSSAVFFDARVEERQEIKGADVTVRGSDQPHQIIYGQVRVGGVITFVTTDVPGGGEWIHTVTTIAGHKCKNLLGLWVDGRAVPFGSSGGNIYGWSTGSWAISPTGYAFISFSNGDDAQVANADLVAQSAALFPGIWTSDHRQRGLAHIYNIFYFSPEKFPNGFPELQFKVNGKDDIYDPRTLGYGWSWNAALCIADYLSNTKFGLGAAYGTDIDLDNLIEAADICDENVTLADASTEDRYTINAVFDSSEEPQSILKKMQTAIGGPIVYQGGKWRIYPAKWRTPSITITEDDIVSSVKVQTQAARRDLFNGVQGTYLNPTTWEIEDFPVVTNAFYEAEDGEQILEDVTLPCTTSSATAQRLAKLMLERSRQAIEVDLTCTLKAFQAQVADNVYLTLDRLGWSAKAFEVRSLQLVVKSDTLAVNLSLRETAEAVFDWAGGSETVGDVAPNTTLPDPTYVSLPANVILESGTKQLFVREDGTVFSRVRVSWDAILDPFVRNGGQVEIQAKNDTQGGTYQIVSVVPGDQTQAFVLDVRDGDTYTIGVRFSNTLHKKSDWVSDQHLVVGKIAPPTVVSTLTGTPTEVGIDLSWPAITDADLSHYVLAYGDDRENRLLRSEAFDNASWTKYESTVTADAIAAPDGVSSADKLKETTANDEHYAEQAGLSIVSGTSYRFAVHLKQAERSRARIKLSTAGFSGAPYVDVNLDTGKIVGSGGGAEQAEITAFNDDWYRVEFVADADGTHGAGTVRIHVQDDSGTLSYAGNAANGIYVWGALFQLESHNGKYKMTAASTATAGTRTIIAAEVDTTKFTWGIQSAGSYDVNVVAVDTSGNESVKYTSQTVTVAAPSKPQNLVGQIVGPDLILTWSAPLTTQFTVEQYEVKDGGTTLDIVKGNLFQKRAMYVGSKTFTVAAIDLAGNSGATESVEVVITAPSAVQNLRSVVVDNNVLLYFDAPSTHTLPIDYYLIKKGATFGASVEVGQTSRGFINLFETLGGAYKYWAVAYDTGGNAGTEFGLDVAVNQPPDFILYDAAVIDPDDYNTFTNALVAEDGVTFYAPVVTGETWSDHFTNNSNTTIQDFIDDGFTIYLEPAKTGADAVVMEQIDLGVVLASSLITCAITETQLVGTGMTVEAEIEYSEDGSSWTSGGAGNTTVFATEFRYIRLTYTITADDNKTLSQFSNHNYRVQVKKQTDSGVIEVTANPTTVTFNLDFVDISAIVLTPQGTTALIAVADFTDTPNPTDFDIYLFDSAGANASGAGKFVRWTAEGAISPA